MKFKNACKKYFMERVSINNSKLLRVRILEFSAMPGFKC